MDGLILFKVHVHVTLFQLYQGDEKLGDLMSKMFIAIERFLPPAGLGSSG